MYKPPRHESSAGVGTRQHTYRSVCMCMCTVNVYAPVSWPCPCDVTRVTCLEDAIAKADPPSIPPSMAFVCV